MVPYLNYPIFMVLLVWYRDQWDIWRAICVCVTDLISWSVGHRESYVCVCVTGLCLMVWYRNQWDVERDVCVCVTGLISQSVGCRERCVYVLLVWYHDQCDVERDVCLCVSTHLHQSPLQAPCRRAHYRDVTFWLGFREASSYTGVTTCVRDACSSTRPAPTPGNIP